MDLTALSQRKQFSVLLVVAIFALITFSAAQNSKSASTTKPSGTASADASKAAPDKAAPADSDRGLVEGAQDQVKKLQNYMNPPPAPKDMGRPDVKVWADLRTALYFCPGSKQYGHTSKGKFMTQKDAQDSNFEPAPRVPCPAEPVAAEKEKKMVAKTSKTTARKSSTTSAGKQQN